MNEFTNREITGPFKLTDEFSADIRFALVPDYHWNVINIEGQRIAKKYQHKHRNSNSHSETSWVTNDMYELFAANCAKSTYFH